MPKRSRSRSHSPRRRRSTSRERVGRLPDVRRNVKQEGSRDSREREREHRHGRSGVRHEDRGDDRRDRRERSESQEVKYSRSQEFRRRGGGRRDEKIKWGRDDEHRQEPKEPPKPKEKANLGLSGKLAEDTNMYKGVLIKYSEPANARIPKKRWRLYPFKGDEAMKPLYVHRQSGYLIGRDRKIADIPLDHPSISKQHAAFQYRQIELQDADGSKNRVIKPYIIDLESANGTYLNGSRIDAKRYVELKERDVIKFGFSTREYVVLSENANQQSADDHVAPSESDSDPEA